MGVLLKSYAKTVVANFVLLLLEKRKNLMQISLIRYNYTVKYVRIFQMLT